MMNEFLEGPIGKARTKRNKVVRRESAGKRIQFDSLEPCVLLRPMNHVSAHLDVPSNAISIVWMEGVGA